MTSYHGLTLVLIAAGMSPLSARGDPPPRPANPGDARILLRVELAAVTVIVKRGRTVVYEVPRADQPLPRPPRRHAGSQTDRRGQAGPPTEMARPDRKPGQAREFSRAELEELVKRLRAGGSSAPLKPEPVREPWLIPWPAPAWGVEGGRDSVTVWAEAFDYEVLFEVRLSGQGRAPHHPGKSG
jgi:hypothetical protein